MSKSNFSSHALNFKKAALFVFAICLVASGYSQGNSGGRKPDWVPGPPPGKGPRSDNRTPFPPGLNKNNSIMNSVMMTPTGWGSTESHVFATLGGSPKQLYGIKPDMALRLGFGIGDARKIASVTAMVNFNDVSKIGQNLSYSVVASRDLGKGGSVSVGALHLFPDTAVSDGTRSFYIAYSNAFRKIRQVTPGNPRLSFTLGFGSGNFYTKSPIDYIKGKGDLGTGVFANVSYDVLKNWSVSAEWTGMNLGFTSAYQLPGFLPQVFAGVTDVTRYSGDRATFVFGVGKAFGFK